MPDAARLTGVSPWRIRRWLKGYEFKVKHGRHRSPAVWNSEIEPIDHTNALGFLDLLEVRCVDAFISAGVNWKTLRHVHDQAHKTVGHTIFFLKPGWVNLPFWDQANKFTKCFPDLIKSAECADRGSAFFVTVNGKIKPL